MKDQPFCIEDRFYMDIERFVEEQDFDQEEQIDWVNSLPDNWTQEVYPCQMEKCFVFDDDDVDAFAERLIDYHDDRFGEDDSTDIIKAALLTGIDFEKINAALPELWYPIGHKEFITKQDLIDSLTPQSGEKTE